MAASDKFIQGMVELLDKLIDYQSKNADLLSEIKANLNAIKQESHSILENIQDKLPEKVSREQELQYEKFAMLAEKIENSNARLSETMSTFDTQHQDIKTSIDNSCKILNANSILIKNIHDAIVEEKLHKQEISTTINNINSFILSLRSKRFWVAAIVGAIAALATAFSSVVGAWEKINAKAPQQTITTETHTNETK